MLREAFPDRLPGLKAQFYANVIHTAVKKVDPPLSPELIQHIQQHPDWVKEIATLVSLIAAYHIALLNTLQTETRVSNFRGAIKRIAEAKVIAHYDVDPSNKQAADRLKAALQDARYIFPDDVLVSYDGVYLCLLTFASCRLRGREARLIVIQL